MICPLWYLLAEKFVTGFGQRQVDQQSGMVYSLPVTTFTWLNFLSSALFLFYGISCLFSARIKQEFKRYGLQGYRGLVGVLELAGSVGLFIGLWVPVIGGLAALGLSVLMLMGLVVRLKIRDGWIKSSPALACLLLNLYLLAKYIELVRHTGSF